MCIREPEKNIFYNKTLRSICERLKKKFEIK